MSREHIAQKLKELRQKSGLTADEVGAKIGKSGKTVNAWENNRGQPDAEILIELCDIYNVDNILKEFREHKTEIISLSNHEKKVVTAYRDKPDMQPAVDKLLGVEDEQSDIPNNINIPEIPAFRHPGELTKYKRQKLGLTQEELAQKLDIPKRELIFWEQLGTHINPRKIGLLASILGIDIMDLFPLEDGILGSAKVADSK